MYKRQEQLLAGDIVPITVNKKDILLQVDRDLNSVILRTNQEIKIPDIIGRGAVVPEPGGGGGPAGRRAGEADRLRTG